MMSAPDARTSAGFIALTVAAVPTGMKAGVRISPRRILIVPARARPSRAAMVKAKRSGISFPGGGRGPDSGAGLGPGLRRGTKRRRITRRRGQQGDGEPIHRSGDAMLLAETDDHAVAGVDLHRPAG